MGPPVLPGYSLRVQLFSPLAHASGDRPIRCFRVVTQPEATVREFCQEASRIHEINYGQPLAIKKVQDDQEFDVTQSEILGHLFTNTATVRVIQAAANPSIRDSVPPTSALRFDPNVTRKREREGSVRPNGIPPSSTWNPNKRQRVSQLDPDEPLPSRENEPERRNGRLPEVKVIPDSQDEGSSPRQFNTSRQTEIQNDISNHVNEIQNSSPLVQASERAHSNGSQRAKSSSYHISRPTERGTSVSTAATSPFSVDQQTPTQNGLTSATKRKRLDPSPKPRPTANRSMNEDTIYDSIASEDEGATTLRKKKSSLKMQNSPNNALPGVESIWSNSTFNTPPNGTRRPSRSREGSSAGELPLTPNSKEREKRQQDKAEADEAKRARRAAAEAAEQRRLEAEEARQAEESRIAKEERAKREEQERLEVEEFQREEAKRQAVIAKTAHLHKEREENEKKQAEEKRRLEKERIAKEKAESERSANKKAEAEAKKLREEEEKERQRQPAEAERVCQEEERVEKERRAAEEATKKSISPEEPRKRHSSSPILPRTASSSAIKPQSATPYIPSGRKSALKSSLSSQAIASSSPSSPEISRGVGIEAQMPLPPAKMNRKVSFDLHERKETPIKPPTRILPPPKSTTPKASSLKASAPVPATKTSIPNASSSKVSPPAHATPKASSSKISPPPQASQQGVSSVKRSKTPIPVPSTLKRPSLERSITPASRPALAASLKEPSPQITATRITPPARSGSQKSETPSIPPKEVIVLEDSSNSSSDSDSEEDIPAKVNPAKSAKPHSQSLRPALPATVVTKPEVSKSEEEEEIDEDETQSHNSSTRDSRSPVIYSQHMTTKSVPNLRLPSPQRESRPEKESSDSDSSESSSDDEEEDDESTPKPKAKDVEMNDADEESEDSESDADAQKAVTQDVQMKDAKEEEDSVESESESESESEGMEVQIPKSSPPIVPAAKSAKVSAPKPSQANNILSTANSSAVPSSSAIRPTFKVGASLSSMNSSKLLYKSTPVKPLTPARSSQPTKVNMDQGSDSEEEEESDENSTFSSDEEPSKPTATKIATKSQPKATYPDSSDSDSSESDDEKGARNELTVMIANLANGNSQVSVPSPKAYRSSTQQQEVKKYGKKGEKKVDKWTTGQKFSMPP
ncbi:hypothetical protein L207DRAFT_512549 [Hyaloscypha variabilis F]|uniref:Nucleolar protein Dnt1-like N-terminal domain-containing protein n=1 Tax=Hyaloscypha variabilis (strain UAMH 11265 / GT02V1 / F) TaxID=1149755 RepID=A0A2J6RLV7_HYAVF|nr:hypothetical protein L207DRAFT_512549 [Hyaloscypha variabilis F]